MELEYEMDQATQEATSALRNTCPSCGKIVFGNKCDCGATTDVEKYYDPDFDDYMEKIELEDQEIENIQWEEVPEETK